MSFTLIQNTGTSNSGSFATSLQISLTGVTAGNMVTVVAVIRTPGLTYPAISISDNQGNTWNVATIYQYQLGTSVSMTVFVYYSIITTGGNITVTLTSSISSMIVLTMVEWSFTNAINIDTDVLQQGGNPLAPRAGPLTGISASDLIIAVTCVQAPDVRVFTYSPGSGFTIDYQVNLLTSGAPPTFGQSVISEYNIANYSVPLEITLGMSGTGTSWSWAMVAVAIGAAKIIYGVEGCTEFEAHQRMVLYGEDPPTPTPSPTGSSIHYKANEEQMIFLTPTPDELAQASEQISGLRRLIGESSSGGELQFPQSSINSVDRASAPDRSLQLSFIYLTDSSLAEESELISILPVAAITEIESDVSVASDAILLTRFSQEAHHAIEEKYLLSFIIQVDQGTAEEG
jgi:hypothetical protein